MTSNSWEFRIGLGLGLCLVTPLTGVWAAPQGGEVQSGSVSIDQQGSHTQVDQSTQSAVIEWQAFNVGAGESVHFSVPGSDAITLNHILDQNPSQILGQVQSNGQLVLANPNGLFFGPDSVINVGALIATTAEPEWVNGSLNMNGQPGQGGIDQLGQVNANDAVAYFSPRINIAGEINAGGDVALNNATQGVITLTDSGIGFEIKDDAELAALQEGIQVSGSIRSDGGYVRLSTDAVDRLYDHALNMDGLISADAVVGDGGEVSLVANNGTVWIDGAVSAGSAAALGGVVQLAGQQVGLSSTATVQADGATGGGEVQIGGGWADSGPAQADKVYTADGSRISADATAEGDGGDVWIWSDTQTRVHGAVSAQGAGDTGSGGFVETSSYGRIEVTQAPDVTADNGDGGQWLLDPGNISIDQVSDSNISNDPADAFTVDDASLDSVLDVDTLLTALGSNTEVTVQTTGTDNDISLDTVLDTSGLTSESTLILDATGSVVLNNNITDDDDSVLINLTLNANNGIEFNNDTLTVEDLTLDSDTVASSTGLTVDALNIVAQDGLAWTANGDLAFDANSDLISSETGGVGSLSVDMNGNNLTLGSVGEYSENNRLGDLTLSNVNQLNLIGNIDMPGTALDLSSGVTSIQLYGDLTIDTNGGALTLADIADGGSFSLSLDATASDGSGSDVSLGSVEADNLTVSTDGTLTLGGNLTSTGSNIELNANAVQLPSGSITLSSASFLSVNAGLDGAASQASDLTLEAGTVEASNSDINLFDVGATQALGELTLSTPGTVDLGTELQAAQLTLQQDPTLSLGTDTLVALNGANAVDLTGANITSAGSAELTLNVANSDVALGDLSIGGLVVNTNQLTLSGTVSTTGSGIDLSGVDAVQLQDDVGLLVEGEGDLTLIDDVEGAYTLTLSIDEGDLSVGNQAASTALAGLVISDGDVNSGTNTLGSTVSIDGDLAMVDAGTWSLTADSQIESTSGQLDLSGTTLSADGHSLTLTSSNDLSMGSASADTLTLSSTSATLNGDLTATTSLDVSNTGAIELASDTTLTGPLNLGDETTSVAINGNQALVIDAQDSDLTLYSLGNTTALDSLTVQNANTLELTQPIQTQGIDGITLAGNRLDLLADTSFDTSSANGNIDLSGIGVNGGFTLTLNAGDGRISLGDLGQGTALVSLSVEEASSLQLGGSINTEDTELDFSVVQAVDLIDDVTLDTSAQAGAINFGSATIDGTYDLNLTTGAGTITLGAVGQNVALQSLTVDTTSNLALSDDVTVIGDVSLAANQLELDSAVTSTGGNAVFTGAAGIEMGAASSVTTFNDQTLTATTGDVSLGALTSENGTITVTATAGSIDNAIDDFVTLTDTSVNVTASTVNLTAGQGIGTDLTQPVVLDVPQSGAIDLSFGSNVAYVVNLNGASLSSTGAVLDNRQNSLSEAGQTIGLFEWDRPVAMPETDARTTVSSESEPLFGIAQPGFVLPSNVVLVNDRISRGVPDVPALIFDGADWRLEYPIRAEPR